MQKIPQSGDPSLSERILRDKEPATDTHSAGVRPLVYLVGIAFTIAICLLVAYSELVASRGGSVDAILLGATHMPPGAIAGLIALLIGSLLLRQISPRLALTPAEMMVVYFMMVAAALLSSFGLGAQLLPSMAGLNYYATPENSWREKFFQHIPQSLVPWDPAGPEKQDVTKQFFEGLRFGDPIPWALWIKPLIVWTILALALFFLMACLATLLRRQWADGERLSFPLVQLPVALIGKEGGSLISNKLLWAGFLIPALFHCLNGLHNNFPQVPGIPVIWVMNQWWVTRPWSDVFYTPIIIAFAVVGFSFLLPQDVSFSMWFFLLFFRFQDLIASQLGFVPANSTLYPARYHIAYQSAGAFFAVVLAMLYFAKPHLKLVAQRIFTNQHPEIDRGEFVSYRFAFWGMFISFLIMVIWCWAVGINPLVGAFMMFVFVFVIMVVLTRCVAEVGLLMLQPIFRPMDIWAIGATPASLGAGNLSVLAMVNGTFYRDPRNLMPAFLDSMKAADMVKANKRKMAIGILLAVIVAIPAVYWFHLNIIYRHGGLALNTWFFRANPTLYYNEANGILMANAAFNPLAPIWFTVGFLACAGLYFMRAQYFWWPFHPLGYAMGAAWPAIVYWFAFFIGWTAKSLILRYGGASLYNKARPFFLGLIFGEFAAGIFWTLLSSAFGLRPPSIPIT